MLYFHNFSVYYLFIKFALAIDNKYILNYNVKAAFYSSQQFTALFIDYGEVA